MNANTIVRVDGANSPAQGPNVIPAYAPTTTSAAVVLNQQGNPAILTVSNTTSCTISITEFMAETV